MKCELCNCDTYIIHINEKHEKVCNACYQENKKGRGITPSGN